MDQWNPRQAWHGVAHPVVIDLKHWVNCSIVTLLCFGLIAIFHRLVAYRFKKVYFTLHVFVNSIIVWLTITPAIHCLLRPEESTVPTSPENANSMFYLCWCFALHVYHPVFFNTGRMDWIHHVPVYILNILMFGCLFSDVFALQAFVMTGLPGGLDYVLLVLEGEGKMKRATYKAWSANINSWFRMPVGFIAGYLCLLGLWRQYDQPSNPPSTYQVFVFLFMGIHGLWNPGFFGRQAIEANIVDVINRFDLAGCSMRGKGVKLNQVRGLSGRSVLGSIVVAQRSKSLGGGEKFGSSDVDALDQPETRDQIKAKRR